MSKLVQQCYQSDQPFTVHVNYNDHINHQEVTFPSFALDEADHEWIQTMWPGAIVTTDPEGVSCQEVQQ